MSSRPSWRTAARHHVLAASLVGHVGAHEHGLTSRGQALLGDRFACLVQLGHDDLRAFLDEAMGIRAPDSLAAPVTIRDSILELHGRCS